jgi:hypothetical protein
MSPTPRWLASYHESGHCVVACALGNRVAEVWIRDDGAGGTRQGPFAGLDEWTRAERFFIITNAGKVAAARRFGRPAGFSGSSGDYILLREYPLQFDADERAALWQRTEQLVEAHWPAICRLAWVLHDEGKLGRKRILELLQPRRRAA